MKKNIICYLNGVSSSGKTSICSFLVDYFSEPTIYLSLDNFHKVLCKKYSTEKWPLYKEEVKGLHRTAKVWYDMGFNVIIDNVLETSSLKQDAKRKLPFAKYIGVHLSLETLLEREKKRGRNDFKLVKYQFERVHKDMDYDFSINSEKSSSEELAKRIYEEISND